MMKRRDFIKFTAAGSALTALPRLAQAYHDSLATWRTFRLTYRVELPDRSGPAQLWLPLPETGDTLYQRTMGVVWSGNADKAQSVTLGDASVPAFYAEWRRGGARQITVGMVVKTADRQVHFNRGTASGEESDTDDARKYLKLTLGETGNKTVQSLAASITTKESSSESSATGKARAIYDWLIDNVPNGSGNTNLPDPLRPVFADFEMSLRLDEVNMAFVALARAAGVPARDKYGIRIAESGLFPSLGQYGDISRAQHARAEFYAGKIGWVPVNPADVCRAMREEKLSSEDPKIKMLRQKAFGSWEMNWVCFNHGSNIFIPSGKASSRLPFFMYPYGEIGGKALDSLDPSAFRYAIETRELVGTGVKFNL